jgi:hypothetical protein
VGLSLTIQQGVVSAFNALGDLVKPATYKHLTGVMVRDLDAGTSTPQTVDYALRRTVIVRFKDAEDDKDIILATDAKFLAPATDLPIDPAASDLIVDWKGRTWEIVKNMVDPANGAIVLLIRKR